MLTPGAASALHLRWDTGHHRGAGELIEVACPSTRLCVAVNNAGRVVESTHPARGARSWHVVRRLRVLQLGGTHAQQVGAAEIDTMAFDLSCPSVHLCVIGIAGAERPGHVPGMPPVAAIAYSTHPARRAHSWHKVFGIDRNAGQIVSVSCPARHLCHALENVTDRYGNVSAIPLVSHDPTGRASTWKRTGGTVDAYTEGLACPTKALCVTATELGMWTGTHALGPGGKWTAAKDSNQIAQVNSVACPSAHLCIAAPDAAGCIPCGAGNDLISTDPADGIWRRAAIPSGDIACPGTRFCIGIAAGTHHVGQDLVFSTHPTGGRRAWHYRSGVRRGGRLLRAIACARRSLCVAVGERGEIAAIKRRR